MTMENRIITVLLITLVCLCGCASSSQTVEVAPQTETKVVLHTPEPTETPRIVITEELREEIDKAYDAKLKEFYEKHSGTSAYNADSFFEAYNLEMVEEAERTLAKGIANQYGVTVDDVLEAYSGQLESDYYKSLDRDAMDKEMQDAGLQEYASVLREDIWEAQKTNEYDEFTYNVYIADNTYFVDINIPTMEAILGLQYFFATDKIDRDNLESFINEFKTLSQILNNGKNIYGLKNAHIVMTIYDEDNRNGALLIFTDGVLTYNAFEDKDKIWR